MRLHRLEWLEFDRVRPTLEAVLETFDIKLFGKRRLNISAASSRPLCVPTSQKKNGVINIMSLVI